MGICMCEATKCKVKETCYRHTKESSDFQSWTDFSVGEDCCNKENKYAYRIKVKKSSK